jgi:DNA replication and repair protein RecF
VIRRDCLQLSDFSSRGFRNLTPDPVSFGAGVTLVTGDNAQGKTNLLEAIALLCGQRSFRGASPADMAADRQAFAIRATLRRDGREEALSVRWSRESGREFLRGEKPASFREVSALAPAVFLAPEHRQLIAGSPAVRRRFLDRLVLGLRPAAVDDLARYASALSERNALLGRVRTGRGSGAPGELEAWTEELSRAGAAVRRHRRAALVVWQREFAALAGSGAAESEVRVEYAADSDSEAGLRAALERLLPLERRRGHSLAGPHRDDLTWTRSGRPFAAQASSGEIARTVAWAKLAEWSAVAKASGTSPFFAADDFDAGLSAATAEDLLDALPSAAPVVLTSSSDPSRWSRRATALLEVRGGTVTARPMLRAVEGR